MYNLYSILNNIEELSNGETKRLDCPECGGYKTFTATNNMGRLLWNCYKASCSISGSKPVHMSVNDIRQAIERKEKAQEGFVMPEYVVPYTSGCGRIAVVVEDCVSAVIVGSDVYVGVAVLGTSLSDIHKRYLAQFSSAVIALDPDALPKAMEFFKDLKSVVNDVRVLRLTDDLKYKHPNDIEKLTAIGEQINGNSINS